MISSLLQLVGLRHRVYYTLTNFRGGGKAPLAPPLNTPMRTMQYCTKFIQNNHHLNPMFQHNPKCPLQPPNHQSIELSVLKQLIRKKIELYRLIQTINKHQCPNEIPIKLRSYNRIVSHQDMYQLQDQREFDTSELTVYITLYLQCSNQDRKIARF